MSSGIQTPRGSIANNTARSKNPRFLLSDGKLKSPTKLDSPFFRDRLHSVMQQGDNYAKKLDFEKRRNADLDACITRLQAMHKEAKVKLSKSSTQAPILLKKNCSLDKDTAKSSDNATTSITQGRGIPILENRLDKLIVRYNDMVRH